MKFVLIACLSQQQQLTPKQHIMKFVNLTPHQITVAGRAFPASGDIARVTTTSTPMGEVAGIPITVTVTGDVMGLPAAKANTLYLVSAMVRLACPNRGDVLSPGALVRDDSGRVIGCKSLDANQA